MKKTFFTNAASHRNAYDLFAGKWASDLGGLAPGLPSVGLPVFSGDGRPAQAAAHLGVAGRLDGYSVLELGPLEAAHTYRLEALGAGAITAVEANSEAFLKCLVVKNIARLDRSTFLLGDAASYLADDPARYDLVFCCGILYHMLDPIALIRLMAARTDRIFLWTHYFRDQKRLGHLKPRAYAAHGLSETLYEFTYPSMTVDAFLGGNRPKAHWLELPAILRALAHFGLTQTVVIDDDPDFANGPAVTIAASRPG